MKIEISCEKEVIENLEDFKIIAEGNSAQLTKALVALCKKFIDEEILDTSEFVSGFMSTGLMFDDDEDEDEDEDENEEDWIPVTDPKDVLTQIYGHSEEEADEILKSTPSEDDAEDILNELFND